MANFSAELRKLGVLQGQRHVLPILAMKVAKAAKARQIDESSALDVYVDYFRASSRLKTIDPYDNGVRRTSRSCARSSRRATRSCSIG